MEQARAAGFRIERAAWSDPRGAALRAAMDAEMAERYGPWVGDTVSPAQAALRIDPADLVATLLAVDATGLAHGHIALRRLGGEWEAKRLIVAPTARRAGLARTLLRQVVADAAAAGARRAILQTGHLQPEAIALYAREGWTPIPVYAPYAGVIPGSHCFQMRLDRDASGLRLPSAG